jgi:hypothetical protein
LKNVEGPSTASDPDADAIQRHHELILEIRALRSAIESRDRDTQLSGVSAYCRRFPLALFIGAKPW